MTGLLFINARVVGADSAIERGWLATSDGIITGFGPGTPDPELSRERQLLDLDGATLLPGFIDVHVHGAVGHEVMDADPEGLRAMSDFFATHGVTSFLATTWTASAASTLRALEVIAEVRASGTDGAQLLGAHMEGPYLSAAKCGAQDPAEVRAPDLEEARRFLDTGTVRLMTLAPELTGAEALVRLCGQHGTRVSIGHTEASFEQVQDAVGWGARHVTHTFNAMPPLHHRRPGPVAAAMLIPELLAEMIADNHHVHPAVLAAFTAAKDADGVVLVTDALRPTGLNGGDFEIGHRRAVLDGGVVRLTDGTMAGSVLTMDVALRNLMQATGWPLTRLWPTATRNAALAAGVADHRGAIARGFAADLVVVGADIDVRMTVVAGRIVHTAAVAAPVR